MRLRVPRWCPAARLTEGKGGAQAAAPGTYAVVEREWKRGDIVQLDLDMPVRMILPDPREKDNAGQAVLARGPLI